MAATTRKMRKPWLAGSNGDGSHWRPMSSCEASQNVDNPSIPAFKGEKAMNRKGGKGLWTCASNKDHSSYSRQHAKILVRREKARWRYFGRDYSVFSAKNWSDHWSAHQTKIARSLLLIYQELLRIDPAILPHKHAESIGTGLETDWT